MSTDPDCLSLADYVRGLVDGLAAEDPLAYERLRMAADGDRLLRVDRHDGTSGRGLICGRPHCSHGFGR